MVRSMIYAVVAVCSMGAAVTSVTAAELTNPTPMTTTTTTDEAKIPAGSDFSNGPQGGGATLGTKDHVPTGSEFSNGPAGGAAVDPTPRRMPTGSEFSNGPSGISKE